MADEPKIFIDEDWKAQVQREKEEAQQKAESAPEEGGAGEGEIMPEPGEPSFAGLLQSLAAQCAYALGLIAQRDQGQVMVDIVEAKYCIDTLMMLRAKTKGNLTPEEEGLLANMVAELQQVYVVRAQQVQEAELKKAGIDLGNLGGKK
ncbi:MAG: DUF1844 domain-containing protein [Candidatus Hydrogenedentes bacterium]|nr:DUF1844 domain-containing protein [Candidatus Hydrogenedentota bacterium]